MEKDTRSKVTRKQEFDQEAFKRATRRAAQLEKIEREAQETGYPQGFRALDRIAAQEKAEKVRQEAAMFRGDAPDNPTDEPALRLFSVGVDTLDFDKFNIRIDPAAEIPGEFKVGAVAVNVAYVPVPEGAQVAYPRRGDFPQEEWRVDRLAKNPNRQVLLHKLGGWNGEPAQIALPPEWTICRTKPAEEAFVTSRVKAAIIDVLAALEEEVDAVSPRLKEAIGILKDAARS